MRDVPFCAIFFPTYAHMKVYLQDDDGYNSMTSLAIAGGLSTLPVAPLSKPFDVIKTRMQVCDIFFVLDSYQKNWDITLTIYFY